MTVVYCFCYIIVKGWLQSVWKKMNIQIRHSFGFAIGCSYCTENMPSMHSTTEARLAQSVERTTLILVMHRVVNGSIPLSGANGTLLLPQLSFCFCVTFRLPQTSFACV